MSSNECVCVDTGVPHEGTCHLCMEPVNKVTDAHYDGTVNGEPAHQECMLRSVVGSIEHLEMGPHRTGECNAHDRGLSYRENARLVAAWIEKHGFEAALKIERAGRFMDGRT